MTQAETSGSELDGRFWERRALRAHIINTEPELRGRARASYYPFERVLAEAIGQDLGQSRKHPDPAPGGAVRRGRLA